LIVIIIPAFLNTKAEAPLQVPPLSPAITKSIAQPQEDLLLLSFQYRSFY